MTTRRLIDLALKNSGNQERYSRRFTANPTLSRLGLLPQAFAEISTDEPPWFCHGLALRMATYSTDKLFARLNKLLNLAMEADGWQSEYSHWSSDADHWAKKWDKFHQFLWLLQCYEYFSQRGYKVSFPASQQAMPDLLIQNGDQNQIYVECYYYSKWWPREHFLESLLWSIDQKLSIKRTHNVSYSNEDNPFSSELTFNNSLSNLASSLTPERLTILRFAAQLASPQKVCMLGVFDILLEGAGTYIPSNNAQGDPSYSWPIFLKEIVKAKKNSNNLVGSRPNIVMVNGLGIDFQFSLNHN